MPYYRPKSRGINNDTEIQAAVVADSPTTAMQRDGFKAQKTNTTMAARIASRLADTSIDVPTRLGIVGTRVFLSFVGSLSRISEKIAGTMRNGESGAEGGWAIALQSMVFIKYYYWYPGLAPPPRNLVKRIATWRYMDADSR
jgi:hypothetical protein